MTANEGVATPRVRARRQGLVTALVGVVGLSVGTLLVSVLLGGLSWWSLQALIPQLDTLIWAVGVAVALPYVGVRDVRFAIAAIALAVVVAVASAIVQLGGAGDVLFVAAAWKALTLGCAALLGSTAGVIDARRPERESPTPEVGREEIGVHSVFEGHAGNGRTGNEHADNGHTDNGHTDNEALAAADRTTRGLSIAVLLALVAGSALMFALPLGWFRVYFSIWEAADPPTSEEIMLYEWTAGLTLAFFVAAVALAIVRRRRGLIVLSALGLVLGFVVAFMFQVPSGRFMPDPAPVVHEDHPVCYGTTGDCPGG